MTEAINPSYEDIRDSLPLGEDRDGSPRIGTAWRDADRWRMQLAETYERISQDESLSDEGKRQQAQAAYERTLPRIEKATKTAREKAQAASKSAAARSVPMPSGKDASTTRINDATTLLAIQNEASAIQSRVAHLKEKLPKGMQGSTIVPDTLRDSFADAMEGEGIEALVKAKATLKAAESLGVPAEEVYGPFQDQRHYEASEQHRHFEVIAATIPGEKHIPKNPFAEPFGSTTRGSNFHTRRTPMAFVPRDKAIGPEQRKRKPAWK
jgi:hypothetical protein